MNLEISQAQFGVRPPVTKPIPEFLLEVTETGLRELISKHYDAIKQSDIYQLFPQDDAEFEQAKVHSADFFIQICGGPAYFNTNRGAPRMVGRHAPFRIDAKARQIWLELYKPLLRELKEQGVTKTSLNSFWGYLNIFSLWMINMQ
ncbi:globin domain-containing protein [Sulfurimonas sp.]